MKVFISGGTATNMDKMYLNDAKKLGKYLATKDIELVFGSSTNGPLGALYKEFIKQNDNITSIAPKDLVGTLTNVKAKKYIKLDNVIDQTARLIEYSDIIIVIPGGLGTVAELSLAFHVARFLDKKPLIILNTNNYYNKFLEFIDYLVKENSLEKESLDLITIVSNNTELYKELKNHGI